MASNAVQITPTSGILIGAAGIAMSQSCTYTGCCPLGVSTNAGSVEPNPLLAVVAGIDPCPPLNVCTDIGDGNNYIKITSFPLNGTYCLPGRSHCIWSIDPGRLAGGTPGPYVNLSQYVADPTCAGTPSSTSRIGMVIINANISAGTARVVMEDWAFAGTAFHYFDSGVVTWDCRGTKIFANTLACPSGGGVVIGGHNGTITLTFEACALTP